MAESLYGGIEAGGTKFVCVVGRVAQSAQHEGVPEICAEATFPTTDPATTFEHVLSFFRSQPPLKSLGVACFGPVDLNTASPTYGYITTTPKPGWSQTDVAGRLNKALQIPVGFDTDVNGAALAEYRWGAARGLDMALYFTIGTGIGGGGIINGRPLHGLVHPEMGHIRLPHDWQADPFAGTCPYHGDCFEGLACGPSLKQRWGQPAETLPPEHPAWDLQAHYVGLALSSLICAFSPQRIILGGGVMQSERLMANIRQKTLMHLNGYVQSSALLAHIDEYIVQPGLGSRSGALGAIALGMQAVQ